MSKKSSTPSGKSLASIMTNNINIIIIIHIMYHIIILCIINMELFVTGISRATRKAWTWGTKRTEGRFSYLLVWKSSCLKDEENNLNAIERYHGKQLVLEYAKFKMFRFQRSWQTGIRKVVASWKIQISKTTQTWLSNILSLSEISRYSLSAT